MLYYCFASAKAHILTQKALARAGRSRQTGDRSPDTALQEVSKGLQGVVVLVKQVN